MRDSCQETTHGRDGCLVLSENRPADACCRGNTLQLGQVVVSERVVWRDVPPFLMAWRRKTTRVVASYRKRCAPNSMTWAGSMPATAHWHEAERKWRRHCWFAIDEERTSVVARVEPSRNHVNRHARITKYCARSRTRDDARLPICKIVGGSRGVCFGKARGIAKSRRAARGPGWVSATRAVLTFDERRVA